MTNPFSTKNETTNNTAAMFWTAGVISIVAFAWPVAAQQAADQGNEYESETQMHAASPQVSESLGSAAEPHANLDSMRSLAHLEQAVEGLEPDVQQPSGMEPDEFDEEIRIEEQAYAVEALREARTQRALDALELESGANVMADAISELADASDSRATAALVDAASNTSLPAFTRQHALETLVRRGAEFGYDDVPIMELLETLALDQSFEVSSTAQRSIPQVQGALSD